jgi:hypothetical protein
MYYINMSLTKVILIVVVVVVVWMILFNQENYGQDASIRAAAGWISGPNYGFDPVQIYADQIEQNRAYIQSLREKNMESSSEKEGYCGSCS